MPLLDDVILPVLSELGLPALRNVATSDEVCVLFGLDEQASVKSLVRIQLHNEGQDLQLWTDLSAITGAARPRMLELLNRLNSSLRWVKFTLVQDVVVMEVDVRLVDSRDARGH